MRAYGENFELFQLPQSQDHCPQLAQVQSRPQKSAGKLSPDTFQKRTRFFTAPPRKRSTAGPWRIREGTPRGPRPLGRPPATPAADTARHNERRRTESAPRSSAARRTDTHGRRERRNAARLQSKLTRPEVIRTQNAPPAAGEEQQQTPSTEAAAPEEPPGGIAAGTTQGPPAAEQQRTRGGYQAKQQTPRHAWTHRAEGPQRHF